MSTQDPPLDPPASPPGSLWERLARELASNPDSPKSLAIMSAVNAALLPRQQAVDQIIEAIAQQLSSPSAAADSAVVAATGHWERSVGEPATPGVLEQFRKDAAAILESRQRRPPPLESIVDGVEGRSDVGYDLGLHVHGLRGTWHRLWALIGLSYAWEDVPDMDESVTAVRADFEQQLGRALSAGEWTALTDHARRHAARHLQRTDGRSQS